jgi:hypothetical protein
MSSASASGCMARQTARWASISRLACPLFGVWAPCLDGLVANLAGDEAGALEVLAEVGNEAGVVESNSHLPQVPYLRFGADCAGLDRSLASPTADLEVAGLIALGRPGAVRVYDGESGMLPSVWQRAFEGLGRGGARTRDATVLCISGCDYSGAAPCEREASR